MPIEDIVKVDPNLERHKQSNPKNYTNMELTKKKELVDELEKKFPNIPAVWLDMCFDWLHGKSDDELEKMVNEHQITAPKEREIKQGSIEIEKFVEESDVESAELLNYSRQQAFEQNAE